MPILDDACRIGRFAILDARYGHYRDRYYRAVSLDDPAAPCLCVFSVAADDAGYAPRLATVPRVVDVQRVIGTAGAEDALFLATPWFVPWKDIVQESAAQGVAIDASIALGVLRSVIEALAVDAPPRMPFVDGTSIGVGVDGALRFYGWRPSADASGIRAITAWQVLHALRDLTSRMTAHGARVRDAALAVFRDTEPTMGGRYEASRWLAVAQQIGAIDLGEGGEGGESDSRAPIDLVRGLFRGRLEEQRELDEELALVPLPELAALPAPR